MNQSVVASPNGLIDSQNEILKRVYSVQVYSISMSISIQRCCQSFSLHRTDKLRLPLFFFFFFSDCGVVLGTTSASRPGLLRLLRLKDTLLPTDPIESFRFDFFVADVSLLIESFRFREEAEEVLSTDSFRFREEAEEVLSTDSFRFFFLEAISVSSSSTIKFDSYPGKS
jgi:hypothetical protein